MTFFQTTQAFQSYFQRLFQWTSLLFCWKKTWLEINPEFEYDRFELVAIWIIPNAKQTSNQQ